MLDGPKTNRDRLVTPFCDTIANLNVYRTDQEVGSWNWHRGERLSRVDSTVPSYSGGLGAEIGYTD
jgi:hypothetical protein